MAHQLRGDNIRFTVYDLAGGSPVPAGVATLLPDPAVRTAEYVVMLGPEARGRGLGTAATRLVLDYAFHVTNLRMVWLKVLAPNKAGVRAYEKAGFRTAGTLREAGYWLGTVCDEILMDAPARDSRARRSSGPDGPRGTKTARRNGNGRGGRRTPTAQADRLGSARKPARLSSETAGLSSQTAPERLGSRSGTAQNRESSTSISYAISQRMSGTMMSAVSTGRPSASK